MPRSSRPRRSISKAALLLLLACGGAQPTPKAVPRMPETPWSLSYADGSANEYTFAQPAPEAGVAFEYVPVTPERSSTGQYSGGAPATASLPAGSPRLDELWRRVGALEADAALRVEDRAKGTGAFRVRTPAGERRFIIAAGAALSEFHAFVADFRR